LDIEAGLLNESSCLTAALGVAKFLTIIAENWVTLYCALKDVQQTHLRDQFIELNSCLSAALGVTKFINTSLRIGSHFIVLIKSNLDV
jgi:hypothetical protein